QTLLGRGYQFKIYDPNVLLSQLRGRNLAYVERHLPHLAALMVSDPKEVYEHASLLVLGSDVAETLDWRAHYSGDVLDLRRDLAVSRHGVSQNKRQGDNGTEEAVPKPPIEKHAPPPPPA